VCVAAGLLGAACSPSPSQAPAPPGQQGSSAPPPPTVQSSILRWGLPSPLSREVAVEDGPNLVLLGGLDASGNSTPAVYSIDPATGTATKVAELARAVHDAAGALLGGSVLVFGGGSASVGSAVQVLQPGQAVSVVSSLPQPRADLGAAVLDGRAYVVGGYDGSEPIAPVLATSDGTSFKQVAQLLQPVRYPAVAALGHYLYVFGGEESGGETAGLPTSDIQQVDLDTGVTQVVGQLPVPLGHAGAAVAGGQILVMGGRTESGVTASLLRFDPATGKVSNVGTLPYPVADFGSAAVGGTVYLLGGEGPSTLSSVVAVDAGQPATKSSRS
jgi:hypothetical protein